MERVHGHIAVLGLAVLLHPVISLPKRKKNSRGMRWTLGLSAGIMTFAFVMGLWIYPDYRSLIKPELIADNMVMALLFESKEHLAFISVIAVCGGCALAWRSTSPGSRKIAWVLLLCGWLIGVLVACLGIAVASA